MPDYIMSKFVMCRFCIYQTVRVQCPAIPNYSFS